MSLSLYILFNKVWKQRPVDFQREGGDDVDRMVERLPDFTYIYISIFLDIYIYFQENPIDPDPDTIEKYCDTPPTSIAILLMPPLCRKLVYTPPICITMRLPFVSRYFCRSIRVRGRWDTGKDFRDPCISRRLHGMFNEWIPSARPMLNSTFQRLQNHYEIQHMAFSSGKICGFSTLGVADICRKLCDLRSKTQIPPFREWKKLSQNPVAVFV